MVLLLNKCDVLEVGGYSILFCPFLLSIVGTPYPFQLFLEHPAAAALYSESSPGLFHMGTALLTKYAFSATRCSILTHKHYLVVHIEEADSRHTPELVYDPIR